MSRSAVAAEARVGDRAERLSPWWLDVPAIGGWTLGFALVVILGLSGGGYDAVVRGEAGIAAWWIAGAGFAFGALALPRTRIVFVGLGLFVALATWTALGLTWTSSTERTVAEVARTAGYLGVFVLALAVCARAPVRHLLGGVATGLAVICGYAVLTRMQPEWFGTIVLNEIFPTAQRRLSQPVGYWNALAGLAAIALPLLLAFAGDARRLAIRALAASFVPITVLVLFLTVSRGGVIAAGLAVIVWVALAPDRLTKLPLLLVTGAGSAIVCAAAERRDALQAGLDTTLARSQGDELMTVALIVMAGVAALTYAVALVERHVGRPRWSVVPRRHATAATGAAVLLAVVAFLGAGGAGWTGDQIDEFRGQGGATATNYDNSFSRLQSVDSNGRYEYWVVARDAQRDKPLTGVGPGTFEYLWAAENTRPGSGFVRDAHSLWAEALGEMGLIGFLVVVGLFLLALIGGAVRTLRAADREHRAGLAAAVGGLVAFCVIASVEWAWEMTVLGATGVVLLAACLAGRADGPLRVARDGPDGTAATDDGPRPALVERVAVGVVALVAIVVIAIPTAATADIRDSQDAARAGDLAAAFERAGSAADAQPYSSTALLQRALILERAGDLERARAAALEATRKEPVNWRTWFVLSRLEARSGNPDEALSAYRRARDLNPQSAIFR